VYRIGTLATYAEDPGTQCPDVGQVYTCIDGRLATQLETETPRVHVDQDRADERLCWDVCPRGANKALLGKQRPLAHAWMVCVGRAVAFASLETDPPGTAGVGIAEGSVGIVDTDEDLAFALQDRGRGRDRDHMPAAANNWHTES